MLPGHSPAGRAGSRFYCLVYFILRRTESCVQSSEETILLLGNHLYQKRHKQHPGEGDSLTHFLFLILQTELDLGQVCGDWTVRIWGQDCEGGNEPVSDERKQM